MEGTIKGRDTSGPYRARVMLHAKVKEGMREKFEQAYETVAERMLHAKGHIQDELIRATESETAAYIVLSEWETKEDFLTWFHDPRHHDTTAPMSPYWYDPRLEIFDLVHRLDRYEPRDLGREG